MSSTLVLEEHMRYLKDEEQKYANNLEMIQKQFGSMSPHGIPQLILLCKNMQAEEKLTETLAQDEVIKTLAQEELAKAQSVK
jgi:hypothetical protein